MSVVEVPQPMDATDEAKSDKSSTHPFDTTENPNKWSKNGFGAPVQWQTGKFTKEESELVKSSIAEYCTQKNIPVSRLCAECEHKAELKGAWMEIAKKLPHRSVQSVYRHGIRQCHPFKRGTWSIAECNELQDLVSSLGKKWSAIQAKMNRSADSCRDKYREMSEEYIKGRWNDEETILFQKYVQEYLTSPAIKNLTVKEKAKMLIVSNNENDDGDGCCLDMIELGRLVNEADPPIHIPWNNISKKMSNRSRLSCFKKWQKLTGIVVPISRDGDDDNDQNMDDVTKRTKRRNGTGTKMKKRKPTKRKSNKGQQQQEQEQQQVHTEPTRKSKRLKSQQVPLDNVATTTTTTTTATTTTTTTTTMNEQTTPTMDEQTTTEQVVDDALAAVPVTVVTMNHNNNNDNHTIAVDSSSTVFYNTTCTITNNQFDHEAEDIVSYVDAAEMAAVTVEAVDLPNISTTHLLTSSI